MQRWPVLREGVGKCIEPRQPRNLLQEGTMKLEYENRNSLLLKFSIEPLAFNNHLCQPWRKSLVALWKLGVGWVDGHHTRLLLDETDKKKTINEGSLMIFDHYLTVYGFIGQGRQNLSMSLFSQLRDGVLRGECFSYYNLDNRETCQSGLEHA
ncbi:hypothetical protein CR513_37759, partial [Mucuna pruriens]